MNDHPNQKSKECSDQDSRVFDSTDSLEHSQKENDPDPAADEREFINHVIDLFDESIDRQTILEAFRSARVNLANADFDPVEYVGRKAHSSGAPNIMLKISKTEDELDEEIRTLLAQPS